MQQTTCHLDFPIKSYDHFTENCTEAQKTGEGIKDLVNASLVGLPPSNMETSVHTYLGGLFVV